MLRTPTGPTGGSRRNNTLGLIKRHVPKKEHELETNFNKKTLFKEILQPRYNHLKFKNMQTIDLIQEIQRLPLTQRFYVVEETIKSIKKEEMGHQMELAANELYDDYVNNKELTAFTSLDFEDFYETK